MAILLNFDYDMEWLAWHNVKLIPKIIQDHVFCPCSQTVIRVGLYF